MAPRPQCGRVVTVWVVLFLVVIGSSVRSARSQDVSFTIIPILPPGKSIVLTFDATITPPPLPAGIDEISTQGLVEGEVDGTPFSLRTDDPTGSGTAPRSTVTVVDAAPDLQLEKTADAGPVAPGERLTYTLTYTNVGTQDATGVELRETVPANTVFTAGSSTAGWSCADGSVAETPCTFMVGSLAAGDSASMTTFAVTVVNALPVGVREIVNTASITDDGDNGVDPTPDNSDTLTTQVTQPPAAADLEIAKTASADPILAGGTLTYTLTVSNRGPAVATTIAATDRLPAGTTLITVQPPSPACTVVDQTVTCTLGTLASGASTTVTLEVQVDAGAPSQLTNLASVSAAEPDPVAGNNTATVITRVNHPPQAVNDTATTPIRTAVTINVLDNDTDADRDPLTVARVTPGAEGGATVVTGDRRSVTYTPARDFTGMDHFRYTIRDGRGGHATASVTVTVTSAAVDLLTPRDQQVVAGQAVPVAAFIVPEALQEIVEAIGGVVSLPEDTETVLFQFRPVGVTAWRDIGTADTPPFFLVPWNTVVLTDGVYELRLMARRATGDQLISPPIQVAVDNVAPAKPPDIVEDPGTRTQQIVASEATVVVMAEGAILGLPANTLPADDRLTITALSLDEAPGIPPGEIVDLLVETTLESGTANVNNPLVVFLPYADADADGLVDGTDIPVAELSLWLFDAQTQMWMPFLTGRVHLEENVLVGTVNRFGVFAIVHVQEGPQEPLLTVTLGDQSPDPATPRTISPATANIAVLQVRVDTGEEDVDLATMAVLLSPLTGDEALLQQLRVKLFHDTNANGSIEASETLLSTASVPNGNQALPLQFTPPLLVPADTTTHLLVAVEISRGDGRTRTVPLAVFPPTVPPWLGVGLGLLAVLYARLRRQHTLRVMLLLCMLGCVLFLTSCPNDGDNVLTATVVLPAQGVTGQSETSGPVSGPTRPLRGASVLLVP